MKNYDFKPVLPEDLKGITLYPEGGRACYLLYNWIIAEQVFRRHPIYFLEFGIICDLRNNHLGRWHFFTKNGKTILDLHQQYLGKFLKKPRELKVIESYITGKREEIKNFFRESDYSKFTTRELRNCFEKYFNLYWELMVLAGTLRVIDRQIILAFQRIFSDPIKVNENLILASIPVKPSFNAEEELTVLYLAKDLQSGKIKLNGNSYTKRIGEIEKKYSWITMGYYDEKPKSLSDYDRMVRHMVSDDPASELKKIWQLAKDDRLKREEFINSAKSEEKGLANVASWVTYLKDYYKYAVNELEYRGEPIFEELSTRSGEPVSFIKDLIPREILSLVAGGISNKEKEHIYARAKCNLIVALPQGRVSLFAGEEAEHFARKYIALNNANQREFKGRVASRGAGRGTAKIILSSADFLKLKEGDILVATNTSPDFVSIMRKAAAIVAEEGGITSHVSVVSRELRIPCVVGITGATDIFNDGDFVEVDASKGVVKILKRASGK